MAGTPGCESGSSSAGIPNDTSPASDVAYRARASMPRPGSRSVPNGCRQMRYRPAELHFDKLTFTGAPDMATGVATCTAFAGLHCGIKRWGKVENTRVIIAI